VAHALITIYLWFINFYYRKYVLNKGIIVSHKTTSLLNTLIITKPSQRVTYCDPNFMNCLYLFVESCALQQVFSCSREYSCIISYWWHFKSYYLSKDAKKSYWELCSAKWNLPFYFCIEWFV